MSTRLKSYARYVGLTLLLVAASLFLQSQIPSGGISGGGGGSGSPDPCSQSITAIPSGLHCNTVTLGPANIIALDTTPFTLVPAQGANTVVFPFASRWKLTFVTTPYEGLCTMEQFVSMWWGDNTNPFSYVMPLQFLAGQNSFNWPAFANVNSTTANFSAGMFPLTTGGGGTFGGGGADPAAYTNQPLVLELLTNEVGCLNYGPALTFIPANPGTGYRVGDIIGIPGDSDALQVTAIGVGGSVVTLGTNDLGSTAPGTFATTGGSGSGLTVTITVQPGDGTLTMTTWYTVAAP